MLAIPYCDNTQQQFRDFFADSDPTSVYFTDYASRISVTLNHRPDPRYYSQATGTNTRVVSIAIRTTGGNTVPVPTMGIQLPTFVTQEELTTWTTAAFFIQEVQTDTYFQFGGAVGSTELGYLLQIDRQLVGEYVVFEFDSLMFFASDSYHVDAVTPIASSAQMITANLYSRAESCSESMAECWTDRGLCAVRLLSVPVSTDLIPFSAQVPFTQYLPGSDPALVAFSVNQARKPDPVTKLPRGFLIFFTRPVTKCGGGNIPGGSVIMTNYVYDIGTDNGARLTLNTHIGRNPVTEVAEVNYQPVGPTVSGTSSRHWYIEYSREGSTPLDAFEVPGNGDVYYNVPLIYNYELASGVICDAVTGRPAIRGPFNGPGQNPVGVGRSLDNPYNDLNRIGYWFGYPFSRTLPLFDANNVMKHVLMAMPVMGDNTATSQSLTVPIGPNSNYMALVALPVQGLPGGTPNPSLETRMTLPAYTFTAMSVGPMTDGGNTMTPASTQFATDIPLNVFPPSISRIELVFVDGRVAIRLFTSTHIFSQFFESGSLRIYQYDCKAFVTETPTIEFTQLSCPQCSELPIRESVDVFVESGQQVDLTLSVCAYISYLNNENLAAARPVCMTYVGECAPDGAPPYFAFDYWVRQDLFSFILFFNNPLDQPLQLVSQDLFQLFCGSVSVTYSATVFTAQTIRLTFASVCASDQIRVEGALGAVQATSSVSSAFNVSLEDPASRLGPSSVVARTDGYLFLQFNQSIALILSSTDTLFFECSSGTIGKSLTATAQGSLLTVTHTPCSSYFGDSTVLVRLVSFNLLFANGQRSEGWTGYATKQFVASVTSTSCSVDVTTVFLSTSMWAFTADSVRMICSNAAVTTNATIITERPFGFLFVNPRSTYGLTCRAEFTLYFGIGLDAYQTLTTPVFEVCLPGFDLAPVSAIFYPGIQELFVEYLPAGEIVSTSVIPSQFVLACGNGTVNATMSFLWATARVISLQVANCPTSLNYTLRVKTGAFLTTSNDSVATNVTTIPELQDDVAYQRTDCSTNAQGFSQNLVYVSGEWDVVSMTDISQCSRVGSPGIAETYFTFTVNVFRYTTCTTDVTFTSPGPRQWFLTLVYGSCTRWPQSEDLLFRYLFAENQDKSKSVAQTQQISFTNDGGAYGLGTMDWTTQAIRYRTDSIGVEFYQPRFLPNPNGGLDGLTYMYNAFTRGNFDRTSTQSYTYVSWVRFRRNPADFLKPGPDISLPFLAITNPLRYSPSRFSFDYDRLLNGGIFASDQEGFSMCSANEYSSGVILNGMSRINGNPAIGESRDYVTIELATGLVVDLEDGTFTACNCRFQRAGFENLRTNLIRTGVIAYQNTPWLGTALGRAYETGSSPSAKSPVVMVVASMEVAPNGTNIRGDILYYDKNGVSRNLPSSLQNFFSFDKANCTGPDRTCAGFRLQPGDTRQPTFCLTSPLNNGGDSRLTMFSGFGAFASEPQFHFGDIYLTEAYNRSFSFAEMDELWARGLPNSMPAIQVTSFSTLEDQTLSNIFPRLDVYDFDQIELGKYQNLTIASVRVASGRGSVSPSPANNYSFIPEYCTFGSPYAFLEVVVSDGEDTSRPTSIRIDVIHVNHPPSSANVSAKVRLLANTTVDLGGQDCDGAAGDFVAGITLPEAPSSGRIFDPNSGDLVSTFPYNFTGSRFIYAPNETLTPTTQIDVFEYVTVSFVARDTTGAQSNVSYITLNVSSNIQGGVPDVIRPLEDESIAVPFTAGSDTDPGSVIEYLIVTLPSQGALQYGGVEVTIDQLPLRLDDPAKTVTYMGCKDCWGPDSFQYLVESLNSSLQSARSTYPIDITEANDPPVLIGPSQDPLPQGYTLAPKDQRLRLSVNASDIDSDREFTNNNGFRVQLTVSRGAAIGLASDVKTRLALDPLVVSFRGNFEEDENPSIWFLFPKRQLPGLLTNMSILCGETGAKILNIILSDQHTQSFTSINSASLDVSFECLDGTALFGTSSGTSVLGLYVILGWIGLAIILGGCCFYCAWSLFLRKYFRDRAELAHRATGVASGRLSTWEALFGRKKTKAKHEQVIKEEPEVEQALLH